MALIEKPLIDCKNCSQPFLQVRTNKMFCSDHCRMEWHNTRYKKGKALLDAAEKKHVSKN